MLRKNKSISIRTSVTSLIAWLSVCLVAAGQGWWLQPEIRKIWLRMGSFALVAAVGLHVARRARRVLKRKAQRTRTQRRIARDVAIQAARGASFSRIAEAVRQVCPDSEHRDLKSMENRIELRLLASHSVRIRPLRDSGSGASCYSVKGLTASVRNISASGVGLVHRERIDRSQFLTEFSLSDGRTIALVVELLWQQRFADGPYHSGGKWVDVAVTKSADDAARAPHLSEVEEVGSVGSTGREPSH